ncbi:hypothetical protein EBR43_09425 [bacterium]|nr:hypothetical protein [bacterium]
MLLSVLKKLWENQLLRSVLLVLVGLTIGLILYPSNDKVTELETKLKEKQTEISNLNISTQKKVEELEFKNEKMQAESNEKIRLLEVENKHLTKNVNFKKTVTTLPDGTRKEEIIIVKKEVEVTEKMKQLEEDLVRKYTKEKHFLNLKHEAAINQLNESHEKEMEKLKTEKLKEVSSSKKLGIGLRYSSDDSVGAHVHYHLIRNAFVMSGLDLVNKNKLRYSIGLGFSL